MRHSCYGEGCPRFQTDGFPGRICLWCQRKLPVERARARTRREYDSLHLLARSLSMYERPTGEELNDPAERPSFPKPYQAASNQARTTRVHFPDKYEYQRALRKPRNPPPDYFEVQRLEELAQVSWRRNLTCEVAENAKWDRAEALRRREGFDAPPQLRRQSTMNDIENSTWRDVDSIASTL